jgi:hypothetical protein
MGMRRERERNIEQRNQRKLSSPMQICAFDAQQIWVCASNAQQIWVCAFNALQIWVGEILPTKP